MQDELAAEHPDLQISILAINEAGFESGNGRVPDAGDLPLLQDDATARVWSTWGATYRDVVILNGDNESVYVFNLTGQSLGDAANYETLKAAFIDAASAR